MTTLVSRRRFLGASAAAVLLPAFAGVARGALPPTLAVARRTIDVGGRAASVFGIAGPGGSPGLTLGPDERFRLTVANRTADPTILHWHGQMPPPAQDGVTETGYAGPIAPGGSRDYDFQPQPGTHWMHSHHGLQEQQLMAAPLIVRTAEDQRADLQEVVVLLHDFTFKDPAELLAGLTRHAKPTGQKHHGASGTAGTEGMAGMSGMPGMGMQNMTAMPKAGMDLSDVAYDAFLANDRTLVDPQLVRTERGGRVRLRLINGATSTAFWIGLGGRTATVIAADGTPVSPVAADRFPMAQGQRLDLLVEMPADGVVPVLAQPEGERRRTGLVLATPEARVARIAAEANAPAAPVDLSLEVRLSASAPLRAAPIGVTHRIELTGSMMPYAWSIDGRTWADHRPLKVARGQRVLLEMANRSGMAHPMHLHGHHFQVVGLNGTKLSGAVRDTVLVPIGGTVQVAFDADNPGRWLLHCHNLLHMATGMMTELAYADIA